MYVAALSLTQVAFRYLLHAYVCMYIYIWL